MENRFAAARRRYLRTHMDGIYTGMLLAGTLEPHLTEIGESAQAMFDRIVEQMKKSGSQHRPFNDCSTVVLWSFFAFFQRTTKER